MFRTRLSDAAKEPANFGGHYRFTVWGCGSNCAAGAVIDLRTGSVFPPPLGGKESGWDRWIISPGMLEGSGIDFRTESRLVIIRGGLNYVESLHKNVPDVYYFVWDDQRFREILRIPGGQSR